MARTAATTTTHVDVLVVGAGLSGIGAGHYLQTECPWAELRHLRGPRHHRWHLGPLPVPGHPLGLGHAHPGLLVPALGRREVDRGRGLHPPVHQGHGRRVRDRRAHPVRPPDHRGGLVDARVALARHGRADRQRRDRRGHLPGSSSPAAATTATTTGTCPSSKAWRTSRARSSIPRRGPRTSTYAGKRIVVIGSGATAVTLVPALARSAAHVTMLQRSPTYVASLPEKSPVAALLRKLLPASRPGRGRQVVPRPHDAGLLPGQPALPRSSSSACC